MELENYSDYDAFMIMYLTEFKGLDLDYIVKHKFNYRTTDESSKLQYMQTEEGDIKKVRLEGQKGKYYTIFKNKTFFAQLLTRTVNHIIEETNKRVLQAEEMKENDDSLTPTTNV